MPLDPEQEIALQLAGTVALPSPFPALGSVSILGPDPQAKIHEDFHLKIVHRIHYRLKVSRIVEVGQVRAILACWGGADSSPGGGGGFSIKTAAEIRDLALRRLCDAGSEDGEEVPWLSEAIVYVPELAPVLTQAEIGMTAAESASYCPPLTTGLSEFRPPHCEMKGEQSQFWMCQPRWSCAKS